jgi:hypothetical protein
MLVAKNAVLLVSGVEEAGVLWGADTLAVEKLDTLCEHSRTSSWARRGPT